MGLPALLYHHVGPRQPGTYPSLTVSSERFERHVRWLARCGYVGVRPTDWLAWCREGKPLPEKPVLFTFDDGYADVAERALPVLRGHGFGAAVFVVTGHIGGDNSWDRDRGSGQQRLMTADQIREWAARGIEFGAHGRTHSDLTTLSGHRLEREIRGSQDDLAAITGLPVRSFAYPYGSVNEAVRQCVRGVFDSAFSCDEGVNTPASDPYALRRSMVQSHDSLVALACRVRLGRYPVEHWQARLRIRSRIRNAAGRLVDSER